MRDLAADVTALVNRDELQRAVTQQVKPLVVSMSALEKAIHIQESNLSRQLEEQQERFAQQQRQQQQYGVQQQRGYCDEHQVRAMIEDCLRDRR